jgi:hypothetical protein
MARRAVPAVQIDAACVRTGDRLVTRRGLEEVLHVAVVDGAVHLTVSARDAVYTTTTFPNQPARVALPRAAEVAS